MKNKFIPKILQFVEMPEREIVVVKTFFVYEFQHWWFGIWDEPAEGTFKWSDQGNSCGILPRSKVPRGYTWTSEWMIDVEEGRTDKDGFVYATRLTKEFHRENNLLDTIRRRRWKRVCMTEGEGEEGRWGEGK